MALRVYNTLSGKKEEFEPVEDKEVGMYVCGQTVYDYMHVGHGKTYIASDIIKRYLEHKGYDVKLVINITDVNEKILNKAEEEEKDYWDIAEKFSKINIEDFETLGINGDVYPKASDYIQEMIEVIEGLERKGVAYEVEGDVFYDVRKFEDYGKLSNQKLEDISAQREDITASEKKKNPEDFVLWRKKDVEPNWDSPWGKGWPGWHIECSTMSMSVLEETLDIHGGGADLIFPHHENEIAQSEAYTGKKFAKYWLHSGLVKLDEEKMSKSEGNIISTREFLKDHDPEVLRLMVASSHYRKEMNFSDDKVEENETKLQKLRNAVSDVESEIRESEYVPEKYDERDLEVLEQIPSIKRDFDEAMDDDFNTPEASKHLFELSSLLQTYIDKDDAKRSVLKRGVNTLRELGNVFGVLEEKKEGVSESEEKLLNQLIDVRNKYREEGKFEVADELREIAEETGIKLEDEGGETVWKRVE